MSARGGVTSWIVVLTPTGSTVHALCYRLSKLILTFVMLSDYDFASRHAPHHAEFCHLAAIIVRVITVHVLVLKLNDDNTS